MAWSALSNSIRLRLRDQVERLREYVNGYPIDSVLARMKVVAGPSNMTARELQQAYDEMRQAECDLSPGG